ncbi:MAG TPA: NAD-dependent epimerase/dehydratase family protein [Streptosporangiaceae bacterium]
MNTPAASSRLPAPGRVLVTGATGLLGSNVTAELLTAGAEVLALARSPGRASRLLPPHERLRIIEGDITDTSRFTSHLRGLDAIIHTAAYFREYYQPGGDDPAQLQRVNVDAVENLLRAATDAGVPVVVHTSSSSTIGTRPGGRPSDEDTPPDPGWERNGYRASKIRAELVIQAWPQRHGLRVPVIVPSWMWGPGDAGPTASGRLFLAVAHRQLSAVPRVGSHIADARDVARAAVTAISSGEHARRYIVASSWQPLPVITSEIAAATGAPAPRPVPAALAMAGSGVIELAARLRGREPAVTRAGTRILLEGDRQHLTSQRAGRELGATFRPLAQTITDETAWYRSHSTLPPAPHSPAQHRGLPSAAP